MTLSRPSANPTPRDICGMSFGRNRTRETFLPRVSTTNLFEASLGRVGESGRHPTLSTLLVLAPSLGV